MAKQNAAEEDWNTLREFFPVGWDELADKHGALKGLRHLPKYDDESSQAWLFGKLLVALLTEKLIAYGRDFSPWGYPLRTEAKSVA